MSDLTLEKHVRFFRMHMKMMPHPYASQEANHLMLCESCFACALAFSLTTFCARPRRKGYFVVAGLDLLDSLDAIEADKMDRAAIIEYIYAHQVRPTKENKSTLCFVVFVACRKGQFAVRCLVVCLASALPSNSNSVF